MPVFFLKKLSRKGISKMFFRGTRSVIFGFIFSVILPLALVALDSRPLCTDDTGTHLHLVRNGYENCFDVPVRVSHFVVYRLTTNMVENNSAGRDTFRRDMEVPTSLLHADYTHSGFDRGHLVPASDMSSNAESARDAGLMTNIMPQFPNFNRFGLWRESERFGQRLAREHGEVIIIAGPLYIGVIEGFIVPIPTHFFRIFIYEDENNETVHLAYIFPHTNDSHRNINDFRFPLYEVERLARFRVE
jgi:endonuclease G